LRYWADHGVHAICSAFKKKQQNPVGFIGFWISFWLNPRFFKKPNLMGLGVFTGFNILSFLWVWWL